MRKKRWTVVTSAHSGPSIHEWSVVSGLALVQLSQAGLHHTDHALGQFDKGYALAQALYEGLNDYERRETAHWATAAAWQMVRVSDGPTVGF